MVGVGDTCSEHDILSNYAYACRNNHVNHNSRRDCQIEECKNKRQDSLHGLLLARHRLASLPVSIIELRQVEVLQGYGYGHEDEEGQCLEERAVSRNGEWLQTEVHAPDLDLAARMYKVPVHCPVMGDIARRGLYLPGLIGGREG